jgi:hypothetical protein
MDTLQRTVTILTDSEAALAALAGDAAKEGSYDAAAFLIDLAKDVANLASKARAQLDPQARTSSEQSADLRNAGPTITPVVSSPIKGRPKKEQYPKFLREGNNLVKIGWSKSWKAEYEHKSPRKTLPLLILAFSKFGSNGRRFSMNKVLPLVDPTDSSRVPDYQAYLCLAWLKNLGFLTQHGRQGYSLTTRAPIEPLIETHWAALPAR